MSRYCKRFINAVLVFVMVFAFNIVAFAQGTTSISVSKSSAAVGDSITVSVSGTESGTITIKYTASMLNLTSCSVSGYTTQGNSVTFSGTEGDIVFSAASAGTASIIVSSSANSGSSTTLTIGGSSSNSSTSSTTEEATTTQEKTTVTEEASESAQEETTEAEATEATETTEAATSTAGAVGTLNDDGGFDINGVSYVVSERYSESEMPSGFSKKTITIGSSTYSEPTNGSITLLYLKPADNTSGSGVFYMYDADAGTVSQFLMLGSSDNYVIISAADAAPSTAFSATTLEVTGGTANAYTIDGSEFFYVYGTNKDGVTGWYVYDATADTVSRMDQSLLTASTTEVATEETTEATETTDNSIYIEKLNLYRKIIMGLIILCVVLLFVIINRAFKGRDDNDDDDFDGDVFAKTPVKPSKRLPRSIVFSPRDREEDDDIEDEEDDDIYDDADDEEYDEEDEEYYDEQPDTSRARYESESYESRRASSLNMMDLNDL